MYLESLEHTHTPFLFFVFGVVSNFIPANSIALERTHAATAGRVRQERLEKRLEQLKEWHFHELLGQTIPVRSGLIENLAV